MIDELERDRSAALEIGRAAPLLVHRVAVDEQENVVAVVAGEEDAARTDLVVVDVVLDDDAHRQEVDRLVERPDAVAVHVLGSQHGRRRGGVARGLGRLRRGRDDLLLEEAPEIVGATGRGRSEERGDEREREGARRLQATTFINLSTSALRSTC